MALRSYGTISLIGERETCPDCLEVIARTGMVKNSNTEEMHPSSGIRVWQTIKRPRQVLDSTFGEFKSAVISDLMNRLYTMVPVIHNLTADHLKILQPACTVKIFPGEVIVVDAGGSPMNAVLGDLVTTKARARWSTGVGEGYDRIHS